MANNHGSNSSNVDQLWRDQLKTGYKVQEKELVILARYHYSLFKEWEWWNTTYACHGSSDYREEKVHAIRVDEIARELGDTWFRAAIATLRGPWEERWKFYEQMTSVPCGVCGETAPCFDGACTHRLRERDLLEERLRTEESRHYLSCWCQWLPYAAHETFGGDEPT